MDLLPEEEIKPKSGFHFAPMIDFLFLMLALFATLAISKTTLLDTDVELVQSRPEKEVNIYNKQDTHEINLSIGSTGGYKWLTELHSYPMETTAELQKELVHQYEMGLLPKDKSKTEVYLHIDKNAPWDAIAKAIFAIREIGFEAHPLYEPKEP